MEENNSQEEVKKVEEVNGAATSSINAEVAKEVAGNVFKFGKELFANPVEKMKSFKGEANYKFTLILIGVLLVAIFACAWAYMDDYLSFRWTGSVGLVFGEDSEIAELYDLSDYDKSDLLKMREMIEDDDDFNMFGDVLKMTSVAAINIFALAGLSYVVIKNMLKEEITFKEAVTSIAGYVFVQILLFVAIMIALVTNIPYVITIIVGLILALMSYVFLYEGIKTAMEKNSTKAIYVFATVVVLSQVISHFVNINVLN